MGSDAKIAEIRHVPDKLHSMLAIDKRNPASSEIRDL